MIAIIVTTFYFHIFFITSGVDFVEDLGVLKDGGNARGGCRGPQGVDLYQNGGCIRKPGDERSSGVAALLLANKLVSKKILKLHFF